MHVDDVRLVNADEDRREFARIGVAAMRGRGLMQKEGADACGRVLGRCERGLVVTLQQKSGNPIKCE